MVIILNSNNIYVTRYFLVTYENGERNEKNIILVVHHKLYALFVM